MGATVASRHTRVKGRALTHKGVIDRMRAMKNKRLRLVFFALILALAGTYPALGQEPLPSGGTEIVITFGGDCTLASLERIRGVPGISFDSYVERFGYAYPFAGLRSVFAKDDLTVVNLENVFSSSEADKRTKTYSFRSPPEYARILTAGSVEAVNIANNHTVDFGMQGALSTIRALEAEGVGWFGATDLVTGTWIYEKNGIKIGFTGAYVGFWNSRKSDLRKTFDALKEQGCDLIISSMHGGSEYAKRHDFWQTRMASWMIREGAALVVGHHPHVLHGVEVMDGSTVIHSLGNLSFGGNPQLRAPLSMVAQVRFLFDEKKTYLGHQMTLLPVRPSSNPDSNDYQPVLLSGREAHQVIALVQSDTPYPLSPHVDGAGAVQPFVPARQADKTPLAGE